MKIHLTQSSVRSAKNDFCDQNSALQAACDTLLRSQVLRGVSRREGYRSTTPLLMPGPTGIYIVIVLKYVPRVKVGRSRRYIDYIHVFHYENIRTMFGTHRSSTYTCFIMKRCSYLKETHFTTDINTRTGQRFVKKNSQSGAW